MDHPVVKGLAALAAAATLVAFGMALQSTLDNRVDAGEAAQPDVTVTSVASRAGSVEEAASPTTSETSPPSTSGPTTSSTTSTSVATTSSTTTTAPTTTTSVPTSAPAPAEVRLSTLEVTSKTPNAEIGFGSLGLIAYDDVVWCQGRLSSGGSIEFRLDRKYSRLTGVVGYSDSSSSSGSSAIRIVDENDIPILRELPLSLGDSQPIDLDVSNVIRLKIRCSAVSPFIGLADGILTPKT